MTPISDDLAQLIWDEWLRALQSAYRLARAERLAELNGSRYKRYDERGVHVYSAEWGRVYTCEVLMPELAEFRAVTSAFCGPVLLRESAKWEAEQEYASEVLGMRVVADPSMPKDTLELRDGAGQVRARLTNVGESQ